METSEFLFANALSVFVVTTIALLLAKFTAKDAATRAAILFTTICLSLTVAPLVIFCADHWGISIRAAETISVANPEPIALETEPALVPPQPIPVVPQSAEIPNDAYQEPSDSVVSFRASSLLPPLSDLAIYLWCAGVLAFTVRVWRASTKLHAIVNRATALSDSAAQSAWAQATSITGDHRAELRVSQEAGVPFVVGVFRPLVVLPSTWDQLTQEQLRDVFVHELTHIARRDPAKLLVQQLAAALYWPVVTIHLVNRRLHDAREEVCDNRVLGISDAASYGDTLVFVAKLAMDRQPQNSAALGFFRHATSLERRVSSLLLPGQDRRLLPSLRSLLPSTGILTAILAVSGILAATPVPDESVSAKQTETRTRAATGINGPHLTVRVVDEDGKPIEGADVLLHDENKIRAGLERRFDNVLKQTDDRGECDFGELPLDHVAILARRRVGQFDESSVYLFTRDPGPRLSPNRLVKLEENGDQLVVTHTMRQGVDLKFEVVDAMTKKPIHFAGIHWKDEVARRWWQVGLLDSGGQHDFTTLVPEMGYSKFRAARAGYEPFDAYFGYKLKIGVPLKRRIELMPRPNVRLSIFTPDGKPATNAKVEWSNKEGLVNEEALNTDADQNGILEVRYPPHPDAAQLKVTHESGARTIPFEDIGPDGELQLQTIAKARLSAAQSPPRMRIHVVDQNDAPLKGARVWVGDGEFTLGNTRDATFELLYGTTDENGAIDMGILPKDFVRVHVMGNGCPQVYAHFNLTKGNLQQVSPRYFVEIEQAEQQLANVTFKLTPPTPVRFKLVDADTGEDVFPKCRSYPELFVRDGEKWWILALIDSAGQHDFAPIIKTMEGKTFRAVAKGYEPKTFTLTGLKTEGIDYRVELERVDKRNLDRVTVEANKTPTIDSWKRFKVGDRAANMLGFAVDGSYYDAVKSNAGQFVLVCYWSVKDKNYERALKSVERIFQRHGHRDDFQINSYWTDGEDEFLKEMNRRGNKFFGRRKWWPMAHLHRDSSADKARISSQDIRPGRTPVFFVLDKEFRFQSVDVSIDDLERTIDAIFADQTPGRKKPVEPANVAYDSFATISALRNMGADLALNDVGNVVKVHIGVGDDGRIVGANDGQFKHVSELHHIESLAAIGGITDAGLVQLKHLKSLKSLQLSNANVTDAGLANLKELHQLELLGLVGSKLTGEGLKEIAHLPRLVQFNLGSSSMTDAALKHLRSSKSIQELHLARSLITDAGLSHLKETITIEVLGLSRTRITDAGLKNLAGLKRLRILRLNDTQISDAGLEELKAFDKLEQLWLAKTNISDAGLRLLQSHSSLREIDLRQTRVTKAGINELRQKLPNAKIKQ